MKMEKSTMTEIYCIHCKRSFRSRQALRAHLQFCEKRICVRRFNIKDTQFIVFLNPLRRRVTGLKKLQEKYPNNERLFLGALLYLYHSGEIRSVTVDSVKKEEETPDT
jgi:hypothetical protein